MASASTCPSDSTPSPPTGCAFAPRPEMAASCARRSTAVRAGSHAVYPFTVMMDDETEITQLMLKSLQRFEDFGFRLAILFSGHFAPLQLSMIHEVEKTWNARGSPRKLSPWPSMREKTCRSGRTMRASSKQRCSMRFWPDRVQPTNCRSWKVPTIPIAASIRSVTNVTTANILSTAFCPDPRRLDVRLAPSLLSRLVGWTVDEVRQKTQASSDAYLSRR